MMTSRSWCRAGLVVCAALLLGGSPARGQDESAPRGEWRRAGLQGMAVRSLAAAPDRLCASPVGRGVFCFDRAEPRAGWTPRGLDGITATDLWIDPYRPDLMFAATDGAFDAVLMFRTRDGGRTWEGVGVNVPFPPIGQRVMSLVRGVPGTSTVFAAGGAVWRSDDLGDTWRLVFPQAGDPAAWQSALEIAPTDPRTAWIGGDLAFTFAPASYLAVTLDGGARWARVWDSGPLDYTPLVDVAAHPGISGTLLAGHAGFVDRSVDGGGSFASVLRAPVAFRLDWSPPLLRPAANTGSGTADLAARRPLAFAAGSGGRGATEAFVSRDTGGTWYPIAGKTLAGRVLNDLDADARWAGLAYAATDDGVYAFFTGGLPLCHDARSGVDETRLWPAACPPILAPGPVRLGDAIAVDLAGVRAFADRIDLGAVHCLVEDDDIAFASVTPADPPEGAAVLILSREDGTDGYGRASDGRPRAVASGDCL